MCQEVHLFIKSGMCSNLKTVQYKKVQAMSINILRNKVKIKTNSNKRKKQLEKKLYLAEEKK